MEPIASLPVYQKASPLSGIFYDWAESEEGDHFHVLCKNTGQKWNIGDHPASLRVKFGLLITIGNIKTITQIFFRIINIVSGNFVQYAKLKAKHEWVNSLDCEKEGAVRLYKSRVIKAIPIEFLKEVGKTLLMAVAIIPTLLIGLFGLVFPYDARKFMGELEMLYAPSRFNYYSASTPCMTDQCYRERETLHEFNKKKPPSELKEKTQKARILHSYKEYFEKKGIDLNLAYPKLREIISAAKSPLLG